MTPRDKARALAVIAAACAAAASMLNDAPRAGLTLALIGTVLGLGALRQWMKGADDDDA